MAGLSQTVLETIAAKGEEATVREIASAAELKRKPVAKACGTLNSRKLIERTEVGHYRLTESGRQFLATKREVKSGPCGPHTGHRKDNKSCLRSRLWAALRSQKKASIPDLLQLAARGDERDPVSNAQRFMKALVDADVVVEMARREAGTAPTSNGFKRYALLRDLGPKTPRIKRDRTVLYDPNSGESYPIGSAS